MYQLSLLAPRNRDPRTYNLPTQDEVAVILPGDETEYRSSRREIVARFRVPGTRLLLTRLHTRVLEAIILTGGHAGQPVLLPRIPLKTGSSAELPHSAQVGVCLETPVLSHGQLYVALSRATNVDGVRVLLHQTENGEADNVTENIVLEWFLS
ncbi:BQ5605_C010g06044 [Microbotryum silenes-dioicae]|uniref:BQ5605_C010g06044 protein n=1 Tax=Microbotryum silenes-dioicae TaxID=796604 RepID=A0A2X0MJL6_9BASI|nr:BQ5605_C010g06044 [Microbotryum silenes-dioicae]